MCMEMKSRVRTVSTPYIRTTERFALKLQEGRRVGDACFGQMRHYAGKTNRIITLFCTVVKQVSRRTTAAPQGKRDAAAQVDLTILKITTGFVTPTLIAVIIMIPQVLGFVKSHKATSSYPRTAACPWQIRYLPSQRGFATIGSLAVPVYASGKPHPSRGRQAVLIYCILRGTRTPIRWQKPIPDSSPFTCVSRTAFWPHGGGSGGRVCSHPLRGGRYCSGKRS
jgi:hypothetical protein